VVVTGDTYPYAPDTTEEEAKALWIDAPQATYVAVEDGRVIGTYTLKPNQPALGAHVCNAGYMVAPDARGKGIGRALCIHSLDEARKLGFRSMQYNLVASTNKGAIRWWTEMGFETVGTVPGAFNRARGVQPRHRGLRRRADHGPDALGSAQASACWLQRLSVIGVQVLEEPVVGIAGAMAHWKLPGNRAFSRQ